MIRMRLAAAVLVAVAVVGTVGYRLFGMSWTDAAYQTVTTVTTVGFRELQPFSTGEKWFTIAIILVGVGAALYTLTIGMQVVVEGHLGEFIGRRRMDKKIADMRGGFSFDQRPEILVVQDAMITGSIGADLGSAITETTVTGAETKRSFGPFAPAGPRYGFERRISRVITF